FGTVVTGDNSGWYFYHVCSAYHPAREGRATRLSCLQFLCVVVGALFGTANRQRDRADADDRSLKPVARLHRAHAGGSPGVNEIAGLQVVELGQVRENGGDAVDER